MKQLSTKHWFNRFFLHMRYCLFVFWTTLDPKKDASRFPDYYRPTSLCSYIRTLFLWTPITVGLVTFGIAVPAVYIITISIPNIIFASSTIMLGIGITLGAIAAIVGLVIGVVYLIQKYLENRPKDRSESMIEAKDLAQTAVSDYHNKICTIISFKDHDDAH